MEQSHFKLWCADHMDYVGIFESLEAALDHGKKLPSDFIIYNEDYEPVVARNSVTGNLEWIR